MTHTYKHAHTHTQAFPLFLCFRPIQKKLFAHIVGFSLTLSDHCSCKVTDAQNILYHAVYFSNQTAAEIASLAVYSAVKKSLTLTFVNRKLTVINHLFVCFLKSLI